MKSSYSLKVRPQWVCVNWIYVFSYSMCLKLTYVNSLQCIDSSLKIPLSLRLYFRWYLYYLLLLRGNLWSSQGILPFQKKICFLDLLSFSSSLLLYTWIITSHSYIIGPTYYLLYLKLFSKSFLLISTSQLMSSSFSYLGQNLEPSITHLFLTLYYLLISKPYKR